MSERQPAWLGLNQDELADFVASVRKLHGLTPRQAQYLQHQLALQLGHPPKWRKRTPEDEERLAAAIRDTTVREKRIGSGLTEKTAYVFERTGAARPDANEHRTISRGRRRRAKRPFASLTRDIQHRLDEFRWASGYLQIDGRNWIIPEGANSPREGAWWYCNEIERRLESSGNQIASGESEFAAYNSYEAGRLFAELEVRLAHNAYFEKQRAITQAQREAPRGRRLQSDLARRERVRHYLKLGDKPTIAAQNAARDLGVSPTTIRRAFPDGLLPESASEF